MSTATLIVSQPGQRARSIEVKHRTVSIGRRPDNTICIEGDSKVSKYHAVIENRDGEFWLTDLGSSNGTTVNNEPVADQRKLKNRDLVCLGGISTIEFQYIEAPSNGNSPQSLNSSGMSAPGMPGFSSPSIPQPSVPGVNLPQVPSTSVNLPRPPVPYLPTPQAPAAVYTILGLRFPTFLAIGGVSIAVVVGALLYGTGVIGGGSGVKTDTSTANSGPGGPEPESSPIAADVPVVPDAGPNLPPANGATDQPSNPGSGSISPDTTAALAKTLAVQISQKSNYTFDPAFAALISRYVNEYKNSGDYFQRASKYRESVDREFINAQGIQPPLIGYVLAMSQTKFVEKPGQGVWGLPPSVAKDYSAGGTPPNMTDPAASTKVAASYIRSLLDLFERDNFMYAVGCYGMSLDQAGKVRTEIERKDPGGQDRFDFWKMKNAGVVQGDQVERVARFFAAGIVCENPRQFAPTQKQLSSLY
jgi:hypothetical protein